MYLVRDLKIYTFFVLPQFTFPIHSKSALSKRLVQPYWVSINSWKQANFIHNSYHKDDEYYIEG